MMMCIQVGSENNSENSCLLGLVLRHERGTLLPSYLKKGEGAQLILCGSSQYELKIWPFLVDKLATPNAFL